MAARIAGGSAMRPGPNSPQAISPSSGPTKSAPSAVTVARLRWVAGCCHIRTFIAGAISTRLSVASSSVVARSLARPCGELGDQVGGGGRDDDEVGGAGELDVAHLGLVGEVEERLVDRLAGQGGDGERGDELGAAARSGPATPRRRPSAAAGSARGLVGGDAAADDQEYPAAGQHASIRSEAWFPLGRTVFGRAGGRKRTTLGVAARGGVA